MKSLSTIQEITSYLAKFSTQVELLQAVSFTDLNRASQTLLCNILSIAFNLRDLQNLDLFEKQNFPAVDLGDESARVAFQVTGDSKGAKIKSTIRTFIQHDLSRKYTSLRFFILTRKQNSYTIDVSDLTKSGVSFDSRKDVVDWKDLVRAIGKLSLSEQTKVLTLLQVELGHEGLQQFELGRELVEGIANVYVRPKQWGAAMAVLQGSSPLFLAGPPHVGKTSTAISLLQGRDPTKRILQMTLETAVAKAEHLSNELILLDDPFGSTSFIDRHAGDNVKQVFRLADRNDIIITSRQSILTEAISKTRLGEYGTLETIIVELKQEGSYSTADLNKIFINHLRRRMSDPVRRKGLSLSADKYVREHVRSVSRELRFPHNIERLVLSLDDSCVAYEAFLKKIKLAKDIIRACRLWFESLEEPLRWRVTLLSLVPGIDDDFAAKQVHQFTGQRASNFELRRSGGGYVSFEAPARIGHPSYLEAVLESLCLQFYYETVHLLDQVAKNDALNGFHNITKIEGALEQLYRRKGWDETSESIFDRTEKDYGLRFIVALNSFVLGEFANVQSIFGSSQSGHYSICLIFDSLGKFIGWSLVPAASQSVIELEVDSEAQAFSQLERFNPDAPLITLYNYLPRGGSIPEVEAYTYCRERVAEAIRNGNLGPFSHTLAVAQVFLGLESTGFPFDEVSSLWPLNATCLKAWFEKLEYCLLNGTPWPSRNKPRRLEWNLLKGRVNDFDLPYAIDILSKCADRGQILSDHFLPLPDLGWAEAVSSTPSANTTDRFSDVQLKRAIQAAITLHLTSLKEVMDESFPANRDRSTLYQQFPIDVTCLVDRTSVNPLRFPIIRFGFAHSHVVTSSAVADFDLHLVSITSSEEDRLKADRMRSKLANHGAYFLSGTWNVRSCLQLSEWLKIVSWEVRKLVQGSRDFGISSRDPWEDL